MSVAALPLTRRRPAATLRAAGREQAVLAGGQLLAGAGNLAFALVCAHLLAPRQFSHLAAFLAAYLLLYMPFSALSAGGALAPAAMAGRRRRIVLAGGAVAVALLVATAAGMAPGIGLGAGLLLVLACAAPVAGPLALERGRALGNRNPQAAITSLLAEPAVRLALGVPAAAAFGAPGAALAVVLGGYVGWAAAARIRRRPGSEAPASDRVRGAGRMGLAAGGVTIAFLFLAVLQNQDVLWANASLSSAEAARFAVLSTLGGMAAFATTTVPLVLLPRARRREPGALTVAVGAALVLGLAAVIPVLLDGHALIELVFGARYGVVAPLAAPYLAAMALLGVSRVLVAHRCAVASTRPILVLLSACVALQAVLIAVLGHDAAAISHATLAASGMLALGLAALVVPSTVTRPRALPAEHGEVRIFRARRQWMPSLAWAVAALTAGGFVLRLFAGRSLWLDEATSIFQARMSFSGMWNSLRTTDVQPPLHDSVLWVLNHVFGDSAGVMRSPSLLAGTLLIPLLYVIGRDLWDRRTGFVAAVLVTVAPFVVWYSQEARMYALFMLFASLALWGQVRILRERNVRPDGDDARPDWRWRWWVLYSLSTAALAWTQYFGLLVAAVQQGAFVIAIARCRQDRRALVWPWLASLALMAALVAPLVPFVIHQYQVNQASGRGFGVAPAQNGTDLEAGHTKPTVYAVLTNLVWGVWGYHSAGTMAALTALWPVGILLTLALFGRGRSWRVALLLAVVSLPVAILFVVGQLKPFLFEIRYFCAGVPVVMLLMARMCTRWPGRRTAGAAAFTAVIAVSFLLAFLDQQFSQTNPRLYDFQGALTRVERQMKPGDKLLYAPQYLNDLVDYYEPHMSSAPLTANPASAAPHGRVFIMASFQGQPQNASFVRSAIDHLLRAHRSQIEYFRRPQVQVWAFQ